MSNFRSTMACLLLLATCTSACQGEDLDPADPASDVIPDEVVYGTNPHILPMRDGRVTDVTVLAAAHILTYFGGKVIPNTKAYAINWNSGVNPGVLPRMTGFYTGVLNSPYMDWLSEYNTVGVS